MNLSKHLWTIAVAVMLWGAVPALSHAQASKPPQDTSMQVVYSYQNDVSLPLYYLPAWKGNPAGEEREGPQNPKLPNYHIDRADPVVQRTHAPQPLMPAPLLNFDGIPFPGVGCNCAPPDTNGEVGQTQYMQIVNEGFEVFDKATGTSVLGPNSITSLWAGFGGVCETNGDGDPVVLYDQLANRWVVSQFAGSSVPTDECVAVSTTSDATGSWNRYGFHLGSNFYDYPKLGMWPDGYYMSMNVFNAAGTAFLGPQAFAFDRTSMLAGLPASFITPGVTGGATEDSFLPADLDGSILPPVNAPNTFVEFPGGGTYKTWHFHVDFVTPANSTFTLFGSPAAAGFTTLCSATRACVPQPGGVAANNLDGLGDRLMFRLAYRNFGANESLVGNYSVSSGGVAGVRWFELRNVTAGPITVFQESTFQPDTTWRWMGSVAMDTVGDLAIGYSASSAAVNPQLRYAGRLAGDPVNNLAQGEAHLFDGTGGQTGTGNRWGDYSALTVDPVDDCTFWYTNEYYATTGAFNWRTRIGSFKFPGCSLTPGFTLAAVPASVSVCAGTPANVTINVGQTSGFQSPVTLSASGNPAPTTTSFTPNPVTPLPGSSALQIGNTAGVATNTYPIQINGTAVGASNQSTNLNLSVFNTAPPAPSLVAPANGATNQPVRPTFSWTGSDTETYTIDVATDPGFSNIVFTQVVTGTSVTPNVDLPSNAQYYWSVTPANACGTGSVSSTFSFTTLALPGDCSIGSVAQSVYSYGFESGLNGWTLGTGGSGTNSWADNIVIPHSGAHSWKANDPATVTDQRFVSPSIALPAGQNPVTLQFWHKRDMENSGATACFDGGILEISTNAGVTWTQLGAPSLLTDPYTGTVSSSFGNPLAGLQAWCNVQDWKNSIVDVSAYGGLSAQFRFRLGSDNSVSRDGWYLDDVKVQSCALSHVVTPSVGTPSGSISPNTPQSVAAGSTTGFTLTPDPTYHIASVGGSCGGTLVGNVFTTAAVSADCSVIANFAIDQFTLTYTAGANGTISGTSPQTVNSGASGTAVTAVPDPGYHFVQWSDASTANPRTDTNVTADVNVTASFAIDQFTLTYTAGANGTISGTSPQTVDSGTSGTAVTAVPDPGYHFVQWSDASTANPRTDTNVTADINVTATFAPNVLVFTTQPTDVQRGGSLNTVVVTEEDGSGNTIIDNTSSVDFSISGCGGSVSLGNVGMVNGVATLTSTQRFYTLAAALQIQASTGTLVGSSQSFAVLADDLLFADGFDGCRL